MIYQSVLQIVVDAGTFMANMLRDLFGISIGRDQEVVEENELSYVNGDEENNNHDKEGDSEANNSSDRRGNDK